MITSTIDRKDRTFTSCPLQGLKTEGVVLHRVGFLEYSFCLLRDEYRRTFVYNICLVTISDTLSDGATKRLILNIERAQHD